MKKLDSHNREIKSDNMVHIDSMFGFAAHGKVVGFTAQKVKVYNFYEDRILNIKPQNLTLIND